MKINIDNLSDAELAELNHKIVQRLRLMHQVRAHKEMFKFKIGDKVTFQPPGRPTQTGILTRFNKKTVTIITGDGGHWNVAPQYIQLAQEEEQDATTEPFLKLIGSTKGNENSPEHRRVGRNEPCPCGSGRKYKKCCASKVHSSCDQWQS